MYKIIIIFACFAVAGFLGVSNWRKLKAASEFRSTASVSKAETNTVSSASAKAANGLPEEKPSSDPAVWPQAGEWPDGIMKVDFLGKVFRWEKLVVVEADKARGWWRVVTNSGEYEKGVATPYGVPLVFDGACIWLQQSNTLARIFVGRDGQRQKDASPAVAPVDGSDGLSMNHGGGEPRHLADKSVPKNQ